MPLLLVARMSRRATGRSWAATAGINFPTNFTAIASNTLFWPAVAFTIEYTVIVTILLIGLGLGLALLVQERGRWNGLPADELPAPRGDRPGDGVAAVLGLLLADDRPDQPAARAGSA